MNIFYLDKNLKKAAEYHCDKHVVKMITEQNQLLSACTRLLDGTNHIYPSPIKQKKKNYKINLLSDESIIWNFQTSTFDYINKKIEYKLSHEKHPHTLWLLESLDNWLWLKEFTIELAKEYTYRYGKIHLGENIVNNLYPSSKLISKGITSISLCMPDDCKIKDDAVQSYRNYYNNYKQHLAVWKNREVPYWFIKKEIENA